MEAANEGLWYHDWPSVLCSSKWERAVLLEDSFESRHWLYQLSVYSYLTALTVLQISTLMWALYFNNRYRLYGTTQRLAFNSGSLASPRCLWRFSTSASGNQTSNVMVHNALNTEGVYVAVHMHFWCFFFFACAPVYMRVHQEVGHMLVRWCICTLWTILVCICIYTSVYALLCTYSVNGCLGIN